MLISPECMARLLLVKFSPTFSIVGAAVVRL